MPPILLSALLLAAPAPRWDLPLPERWRVQPATAPDVPPRPEAWGTMPAADWRGTAPSADGQAWARTPRGKVHCLWYEQTFAVPTERRGQRVVADFRRIEGDAIVFLNGRRLGELLRPGGEVDLGAGVVFGGDNTLTVFLTRDYTGISRDFAHDPLRYLTRHDKIPIDNWPFGITAPVTLHARPRPAAITDVFVMPSWRRHALTVRVEVEADAATDAGLAAHVMSPDGNEALRLSAPVATLPAGRSVHELTAPWRAARPWELEDPYLYRCAVSLQRDGAMADAAPPVTFGFRELWTEGRRLMLNGHPMRWRMTWANSGLTPTSLSFYRLLGFNVFQWQPNPTAWWANWSETPIFDEATLDALDAAGCGATLPAPGMSNLKPAILTDPRCQADYAREMDFHLRHVRNHPCVFAYAVGMNSYCPPFNIHADGMGRRPVGRAPPEDKNGNALAIEYACRVARAVDPTRLAFSHADGSTGDLSTANSYLNFVPLQEREDWPSAWATSGNMPYSAVEFGEPFTANFWKGKQFLLTEYLAMYFGSRAYGWENEAGQKRIVELGLANGSGYGAFEKVDLRQWPGYWEFQRLFVRGTTRAWRTWGVNGGWNWWQFDQGYGDPPGYNGNVFARYAFLKQPVTSRPEWANPNFDIYGPDNQPLLAYLAGWPRHTDQTHAYVAGETIRKQAAFVWDGPGRRSLTARWRLLHGDEAVAEGQVAAELGPGDIKLRPFDVTAPRVTDRTEYRLELTVLDGTRQVARDEFALEVHPSAVPRRVSGAVALWDPAGRSKAWLGRVCEHLTAWQPGQALPTEGLLVLGRESLRPGTAVPFRAEDVAAGLKVLILEQQPLVWEGLGFRNVEAAPRYVFPRDAGSPILDGLLPADLCNWRGSPDLIPEGKPARDYDGPRAPRWTNTGAVASTVMEIPHRAGFTPVLAAEFDLAYSPLLQWRHGRGRVTFCSLDLTDRVGLDPDAGRLATNLLEECLRPAAPAVALAAGDETTKAQLARLGVAVSEQAATVVHLAQPAEALRAAGFKVTERELWHVTAQDHALLRGLDASLLRWRDSLKVAAFDAAGQPAGCTVLLDGLLLAREAGGRRELWLQAAPSLLDGRYPGDEGRREAVKLSVVRLEQLAAQVLTNAGAQLAPEPAARLTNLQAGPGYDDLAAWRVLGPFKQPHDDGPSLIAAHVDAEAGAIAGRTEAGWRGAMKWRSATADEHGFVDLSKALGADSSVVGYAVCKVACDAPRTARLRLGVDYWLAAWVNGQPVYELTTGHGPPQPNRHMVDIPLRAGENVITLKVGAGSRGFGFWANLSRSGWEPTRLAALARPLPSLYDTSIALADPYGFTYW
jgi:beta-galactosidase